MTTAPTLNHREPRPGPSMLPARPTAQPNPQAPPVYLVPTLIGALAVLAATIAIPPMISGDDWFGPAVEVVMVIWLIGVGARLARVPAAAAVLLQIVGASVALTALSLPLLLLNPPLHDVGVFLFYVFQAVLAVAVAMTLWSGYEFFRDVWRQRQVLRTP